MRVTTVVQEAQNAEEVSNDAIPMSIDDESNVLLMDALSTMYSHPARAVLREYLSNALDAQTTKGETLPEGETLPPVEISFLNHILSIRDYGAGLSLDDITNIFSRYGASTKRDNNKTIGSFGLGAKVGFAVGDEFFITSYQQGKTTRYRAFKNSANKGFIETIEEEDTPEELDGLKVEVPIPSAYEEELSSISLADSNFFLGFSRDEISTSMVRGRSVMDEEYYEPLKMGNEIIGWLGKNPTHYPTSVSSIVGPVFYNIDFGSMQHLSSEAETAHLNLNQYEREVILRIGIGTVEIPASREKLTYSERTVKTLDVLLVRYAELLRQTIQRELNACETAKEALAYLRALERDKYPYLAELSWRGIVLPELPNKDSHLVVTSRKVADSGVRPPTLHAEWINGYNTLANFLLPRVGMNGPYYLNGKFDEIEYLLEDNNVRAWLKTRGLSKSIPTHFVICPDADALVLWAAIGESVEVSELEEINTYRINEESRVRRERREAEEAKMQAQLIQVERNPFYFIVGEPTTRLSHEDDESILADTREKFYWSESEIIDLIADSRSYDSSPDMLFPADWRMMSTGSSTYRYIKPNHVSTSGPEMMIRHFISLYLPANAIVVILHRDSNLTRFTNSNPSIKSAIQVIGETIKEETTVSGNIRLIDLGKIVDAGVESKKNARLRNFTQFMALLSEGQLSKLPADVAEFASRAKYWGSIFNPDWNFRAKNHSFWLNRISLYFNVKSGDGSPGLITQERKLSSKYPLIMETDFSSSEHKKKVVQHLLSYAQTVDDDGL